MLLEVIAWTVGEIQITQKLVSSLGLIYARGGQPFEEILGTKVLAGWKSAQKDLSGKK
jgi:hypothetical protein